MEDRKIIIFEVVQSTDYDMFEKKCNSKIKAGFTPLQYSTNSEGSYNTRYSHTFVKYEESTEVSSKQILNAIPYQMCPKCGGTGNITIFPSYNDAFDGTKEKIEICDICKGEKMIPMYIPKFK